MNIVIGLVAALIATRVFVVALKRRLVLDDQWSEHITAAIRDWDIEQAQLAKDDADALWVPTFVLIGTTIAMPMLWIATISAVWEALTHLLG